MSHTAEYSRRMLVSGSKLHHPRQQQSVNCKQAIFHSPRQRHDRAVITDEIDLNRPILLQDAVNSEMHMERI
jgi:hypothetical protein